MKIFGYKKRKRHQLKPTELRETTVLCTVGELRELVTFITETCEDLKDHPFPHGICTLQFRDWSRQWKEGDPDFILAVEPDKEK